MIFTPYSFSKIQKTRNKSNKQTMQGLALTSQPLQRDPIFRDAKFFCFGAINNRRSSG